jgi:hypothetical protein
MNRRGTCRRIVVVAGLTLRELRRQATLPAIGLAIGLIASIAWSLRPFVFGAEPTAGLEAGFGLGAQALLGLALALIASADVMQADLVERRADLLLARDVTRTEWLVGRWLGVMTLVAGVSGVLAAATIGAVVLRAETGAAWSRAVDGALASSLLLLRAGWAAAVVMGLARVVRGRLLLLVASASVVAAAQGRAMLEESVLRAFGPVLGDGAAALVRALPDFAGFDLTAAVEDGGGDGATGLRLALMGIGHVVLALGVAAVVWSGTGRPVRWHGATGRRWPGLVRAGVTGMSLLGAGWLLDAIRPSSAVAAAGMRARPWGAEAFVSLLGGYREVAANLAWIRAQVAAERVDPASVVRSLQAAVGLAPNRVHFRVHGARLLAYDLAAAVPGRSEELRRAARAWLRRAEEELPDRPEIPVEAGLLALREGGAPDEAIGAFGRAARSSLAPEYAGRIEAELLGRAGRWEEARRAWIREFNRLGRGEPVAGAGPRVGADPLGWTPEERRKVVALRISDLEELMEIPLEKRFKWPSARCSRSLDLSEN